MKRDHLTSAVAALLLIAGMAWLTVRTPDPLDRAGADSVYNREHGR